MGYIPIKKVLEKYPEISPEKIKEWVKSGKIGSIKGGKQLREEDLVALYTTSSEVISVQDEEVKSFNFEIAPTVQIEPEISPTSRPPKEPVRTDAMYNLPTHTVEEVEEFTVKSTIVPVKPGGRHRESSTQRFLFQQKKNSKKASPPRGKIRPRPGFHPPKPPAPKPNLFFQTLEKVLQWLGI